MVATFSTRVNICEGRFTEGEVTGSLAVAVL
jgi:hypothetical protein